MSEPSPRPIHFEQYLGAASAPLPAKYRPRQPQETALHQIVREHLQTMLAEAALRSEAKVDHITIPQTRNALRGSSPNKTFFEEDSCGRSKIRTCDFHRVSTNWQRYWALLRVSFQQLRAATLLAAGMHKEAVAQAVGISAATLWRWQQAPTFRAAYDYAVRDSLAATRALVVHGRLRALRLLVETMDNTDAARRDPIAAAKAFLAACPGPEAAEPPAEPEATRQPQFSRDELRARDGARFS